MRASLHATRAGAPTLTDGTAGTTAGRRSLGDQRFHAEWSVTSPEKFNPTWTPGEQRHLTKRP
jgi:hypothetical protein